MTGVDFMLVEFSGKEVRELNRLQLAPQPIEQRTPFWIECAGDTLRSGFAEKMIFEQRVKTKCEPGNPVLIAREGMKLETFSFSATDTLRTSIAPSKDH